MSVEYSIIIPVLNIEQNCYLDELLDNLAKQSLLPKTIHLVVGDRRQGRAINYGVSQTDTKYIATVDDDTLIDTPALFEKLIHAMEADTSIGIGGAACKIPEFASRFQKTAMQQIARRFFPVQDKNTDSDMVQHPCLVMPRELFISIDGEDEELIRGLDPVLRKKVRDAGKRVVIIANTYVYHLVPNSFWKLVKMYYRNGIGSGYANKNYPEKVLELSDGYDSGHFIEHRPRWYRIARRFISLAISAIKLEHIKVATDLAYMAGVLRESIKPTSGSSVPQISNIETEERKNFPFKLLVHRISLDT